jgi:GTPase SAR1 family protein
MSASPTKKSCVIVGDVDSKRKSLLLKLNPKTKNLDHEPLIVEDFSRSHPKFQIQVDFTSIDGNEENAPILRKIYESAKVFVVCFSVVSEESFKNAAEKWIPEIRAVAATAPIILVGTECEQRSDEMKDSVLYEDAAMFVRYGSYFGYHECSTKNEDGIETLLEEIFRAALASDNSASERNRKSSSLLQRLRISLSRSSNV